MIDLSLAVQGAIRAALGGSSELAALVGARIYDRVPNAPTFPYVTIGEGTSAEDGAECVDGEEVAVYINAWSRGTDSGGFGMVEARKIAGAIKAALHEQDVSIDEDVHLVDLRFRDASFRLDPDGETRRAILQYVALVEPVAVPET